MRFCACAYFSSIIIFHEAIVSVCELVYDDHLEPWRRFNLPAVVRYEGLEEIFKAKHQNRLKAYKDAVDPSEVKWEGVAQLDAFPQHLTVKRKMCASIFSSDLFLERGEKHVDARAVKNPLKAQLELYAEIFKQSDRRAYLGLLGPYVDKLENPFRLLSITLKSGTEKAYGFSCLVRTGAMVEKFKMYYVSEEHNFSPASAISPHVRPLLGRFVFGYAEAKNLGVFAVAHESARSLPEGPRPYIEYFFLDKMLSHKPSDEPQHDPVCRLHPLHRLHLVAAIFSMKHFNRKYKVPTSVQNIESDCTKRRISFERSGAARKMGQAMFTEFTFSCRLFHSNAAKQDTFHISRGYEHDKVFVHRENQHGNIIPEWYLYHVGLPDDGQPVALASANKEDKSKGEKKDEKEENTKDKKEDKTEEKTEETTEKTEEKTEKTEKTEKENKTDEKEEKPEKSAVDEHSHHQHPDDRGIVYPTEWSNHPGGQRMYYYQDDHGVLHPAPSYMVHQEPEQGGALDWLQNYLGGHP